jgi:hypothetical protein
LAEAYTIPQRQYNNNILARGDNLNTYTLGPNNIGGRTRAIAFDKRNSNIIISGCISGGIFRSADGGNHLDESNPQDQIHNFSTVAQDPEQDLKILVRSGGEPIANSASGPEHFI